MGRTAEPRSAIDDFRFTIYDCGALSLAWRETKIRSNPQNQYDPFYHHATEHPTDRSTVRSTHFKNRNSYVVNRTSQQSAERGSAVRGGKKNGANTRAATTFKYSLVQKVKKRKTAGAPLEGGSPMVKYYDTR